MKTPLLALTMAIASASSWAQEAQDVPKSSASSSTIIATVSAEREDASDSNQNSLRFGTEAEVFASKEAVEMRRKLSDPALRETVRTEAADEIKRQHPDVAEVLNLSPKEYEALIETRADWQMDHLDLFYSVDPQMRRSNARFDGMQQNEEAMNQKLTALLGEERYGRYKDYQHTVYSRMEIAELNKRLGPKDAVTGERKARFLKFLVDHQERFMQAQMNEVRFPDGLDIAAFSDPKKLEQFNRELTLKSNERHLTAMEAESAALKERAASFLTPVQLARFSEMEEKKIASQRRWVESMRAQMQPKS